MRTHCTRRVALARLAGAVAAGAAGDRIAFQADAACCYFAAKDKDITQPAQKAFISWDADKRRESFTVQPKFEGNAVDFGMVIPTPARPKLDEMPQEFFAALAVFTILEPMPLKKYKQFFKRRFGAPSRARDKYDDVVVLEEGVVGSLDYKIILAKDAGGLYRWLDEHDYHYGGDEQTLDHYIQGGWFFTVMKIDPKQMKQRDDGTYEGNVTPTRFTFSSREPVYPLRITRISVKEFTEALFYVQAKEKMDLPEAFSYRCTWQPMWAQAMGFAVQKTPDEEAWEQHVEPLVPKLLEQVERLRGDGLQPATLEWARRITGTDVDVIDGTAPYNRDAPATEVEKLKLLRGHIRQDQFVTKFRKVFHVREMDEDLVLVPATAGDAADPTEYFQILPTSPP